MGPTTNRGMQNGSSVGTCARCMHVFARSVPIRMLSRCLSTKISASELSREVYHECVVGWVATLKKKKKEPCPDAMKNKSLNKKNEVIN